MKKKILFLCTGNSCRSQMAEGFAKSLLSEKYEAFSAGTSPHGINEYAVKVMKEVGIDISSHTSDNIDKFRDINLDLVVTVCDNAASSCPTYENSNTEVMHAPFDDPPALAKDLNNEEEILSSYRRVRDEVSEFIKTLS